MGRGQRLLCLMLLAVAQGVAARQDPDEVRRVVDDFLRVQTRGLPGSVSHAVGSIDPANNLMPCPALEPFMPSGARPFGKTNVGVRCQLEGGWTIYVPVQVKVMAEYWVAAKPLARGHVMQRDDLLARRGDLAQLPAGAVTDPAQAIGKTLSVGLTSGQLLRSDSLQAGLVVQQGQSVKVMSRGAGFQVASEGRALNNASDGQVVQVRVASGQTVSGIARAGGVVEVGF